MHIYIIDTVMYIVHMQQNCLIPYVSDTHDLESINSLRLSYLPKRTSFGFEAMEARGLVTLLDHYFHLHRKYLSHEDGLPLLHRTFKSK